MEFLLDFAETNDACSDEMILIKRQEYFFLLFDFCCVLLALRYSVLLILVRKMLEKRMPFSIPEN